MALQLIRHFYSPEYMVKDAFKLGEIPGTKKAYSTVMDTAGAAIIEAFLIALIGMVDTVMVSSVGNAAIAAVGLCNQPRFIVQALVMSMNVAVTSICARRRGEENPDAALACLKQSLVLCSIISVVVSVAAFFLSDQMMWLAGAQPDTFDLAKSYFQILVIGIPMNNLSLTISAAQRGIGHTNVTMKINISANIVSLVFNFFLINGLWIFPKLGVSGAAIATVMGWTVGLIFAIISVTKRNNYYYILTKGDWKLNKEVMDPLFKILSGSFIEQLCIRVGFLLYARVVAGLGTAMTTAHFILQNIMSLSFCFGDGFSISASSLVGRSLGAKRSDLSIVYGKICQRLTLLSSFILFFVFWIFGDFFISMFTADPQIVTICTQILFLVGIIIFGQSSQMVFMGSLRGAGDTMFTAIISLISIVIIRPIVAYTFAYNLGWGLMGAWIGFLVDQYLRLALTYLRFSSGNWRSIKV